MRSTLQSAISVIPFLAALTYALPQASVVGFPQSNANAICALNYDNPEQTWKLSGAAFFLDKFLQEKGVNNWANRLDQLTTDGGSQGISNLDCTDFGTANCAFPTVQCKFFTPPALFHIRQAMATFHAMLNAYHEALQNNAIKEILNVGNIVSDFGEPAQDFNVMGGLNAAMSIASGLTAAVAPLSGAFSVIGGIFGFLASANPPAPLDPTAPINARLSAAFAQTDSQLEAMAKTVFGGVGNTAALPGVSTPGSNREVNDIAKFFSGGKFLIPVTSTGAVDSMIKPVIADGARRLRQSLVNAALKAQGYYIFVNTETTQSQCSFTGSRWIDNQCFIIHKFTAGISLKGGVSNPIAPAMVLKFDDPKAGYNINMEQFYRNADACQTAHPNFDGEMATTNLPTNGALPECFFNLPVIKSIISPCVPVRHGANFPTELGITKDTCKAPITCLRC